MYWSIAAHVCLLLLEVGKNQEKGAGGGSTYHQQEATNNIPQNDVLRFQWHPTIRHVRLIICMEETQNIEAKYLIVRNERNESSGCIIVIKILGAVSPRVEGFHYCHDA